MSVFRGTLFFNASAGRNGWTEKYYPLGTSLSVAATQLLAVLALRQEFLHEDISITAATLSDVAVRGDSTTVTATNHPGAIVDATGYLNLDACALFEWQCGVYRRNKTFCRGIPLGMTFEGKFVPTGAVMTAVNAYVAGMVTNCQCYGSFTVNPTPPPAFTKSYSPISGGGYALYLARRKTGRPTGLPRGRRLAG